MMETSSYRSVDYSVVMDDVQETPPGATYMEMAAGGEPREPDDVDAAESKRAPSPALDPATVEPGGGLRRRRGSGPSVPSARTTTTSTTDDFFNAGPPMTRLVYEDGLGPPPGGASTAEAPTSAELPLPFWLDKRNSEKHVELIRGLFAGVKHMQEVLLVNSPFTSKLEGKLSGRYEELSETLNVVVQDHERVSMAVDAFEGDSGPVGRAMVQLLDTLDKLPEAIFNAVNPVKDAKGSKRAAALNNSLDPLQVQLEDKALASIERGNRWQIGKRVSVGGTIAAGAALTALAIVTHGLVFIIAAPVAVVLGSGSSVAMHRKQAKLRELEEMADELSKELQKFATLVKRWKQQSGVPKVRALTTKLDTCMNDDNKAKMDVMFSLD